MILNLIKSEINDNINDNDGWIITIILQLIFGLRRTYKNNKRRGIIKKRIAELDV